jgi:hypothetical protein
MLHQVHDATGKQNKSGIVVEFAVDGVTFEGGRNVKQITGGAISYLVPG